MDELLQKLIEDVKVRSRVLWEKGLEAKQLASVILDEQDYRVCSKTWDLLSLGCVPENGGYLAFHYWFDKVRGTEWARENCPDALMYHDEYEYKVCPTCLTDNR
jgi:hypothetical protein